MILWNKPSLSVPIELLESGTKSPVASEYIAYNANKYHFIFKIFDDENLMVLTNYTIRGTGGAATVVVHVSPTSGYVIDGYDVTPVGL